MSKQGCFSSLLSIDPYNNTFINSKSNFFNKTSYPTYSKDQHTLAYLDTKNFIHSYIDISKSISDEDLYDALYTAVYEELALDQAISYKMGYVEVLTKVDGHKTFHIFLIDPLIIEKLFKDIIKSVKYIEYILPSSLLYRSLYSKEILEGNGADCFVYFQESDACVTIYSKKKFVYTKSINYSLKEMYKRFCEISSEMITYESFIDLISNETPKTADLIKLYKEIVLNINEILIYVKRALNIENIESIYLDTTLQKKINIHENIELELGIKSKDFDFILKENQLDHFSYLAHLYPILKERDCNFTLYNRPAKFLQRESGRLILFLVASFVALFLYPLYYLTLTYLQSLEQKHLINEYETTHIQRIKQEVTLKESMDKRDRVLKSIDYENKAYLEKKEKLTQIYHTKVNYTQKADLLYTFTKALNLYEIKLNSLSYKSVDTKKILTLNISSSDDKKITDLLEYFTKTYDGKFHFFIEKISYIESIKLYSSELKATIL